MASTIAAFSPISVTWSADFVALRDCFRVVGFCSETLGKTFRAGTADNLFRFANGENLSDNLVSQFTRLFVLEESLPKKNLLCAGLPRFNFGSNGTPRHN